MNYCISSTIYWTCSILALVTEWGNMVPKRYIDQIYNMLIWGFVESTCFRWKCKRAGWRKSYQTDLMEWVYEWKFVLLCVVAKWITKDLPDRLIKSCFLEYLSLTSSKLSVCMPYSSSYMSFQDIKLLSSALRFTLLLVLVSFFGIPEAISVWSSDVELFTLYWVMVAVVADVLFSEIY